MSIRFLPSDKPFTPNKLDRRGWLALLLVLVVAGTMRFVYPEAVGYAQDQADLVTLVEDMLQGKSFPLVGIPSSSRFPNSPVTVYVLAPSYAISDSPIFTSRYIALLNVIAIGLFWFICYRYFSPTVALIAGLAYALNPWAIAFSRDIWAQDYLVPFLLLSFLLGLYGFLEGNRIAQILCLPILLWAVQIHIAAWALMPVYFWLLWVGRKRTSWKVLAISAFLSALVMLPFGLGVIKSFTQSSSFNGPVQTLPREKSLRGFVKPYGQMAWLMTGLGLEQYGAREKADELIQTVFGGPAIMLLWLLLGASTLLGVLALWKRYTRSLVIFALLWAFFPLLFTTIPLTDVFPFYFIGSIPALGLLAGIGVVWLLDLLQKSVIAQRLVLAVVALIFLTQGFWMLRVIRWQEDVYVPGQFGTIAPISYTFGIRDQLKPYQDIVVLGSGEWADISNSGAHIWASLLRDTAVCVRDIGLKNPFLVIPKGSFATVFTPNMPDDAVFDSMYRVGNPTVMPLRSGEGEYNIYNIQQISSPDDTTIIAIPPTHFENGVDLTGYGSNKTGLVFQWALPKATPENYLYQVTFLDSNGSPIGEPKKLFFWQGLNWCAGDQLLSQVNETPPAGTASIQVMMMHDGTQQPLNVLDDAGKAVGTSVDVPVSED